MNFGTCYNHANAILMEGALGERLKREYGLSFDENVAMASLIYGEEGRHALQSIWEEYIAAAKEHNLPFLATTPTRRANMERIACSKFDEKIIEDNVHFLTQIKKSCGIEMYTGGLMGCKGDAYQATEVLSAAEAFSFHSWQADLFKNAGADFLFAGIMPALPEAVGMAKAMEQTELPYIISFMIRENGRLIDGHPFMTRLRKLTIRQSENRCAT
jgi:S-methylmethionine-dependent homocysteine/selenocysteine methylase